nr:CMP-N-acetylneuraminate-poly-alpha-2,8-sialyltransferase-like [Lytechinus pictus]
MFKFSPLTVNSEDKYIEHYIEDIRNYTNSTVHTLEKDAFIFDYKEKNINATVALEIRNKVQKIMKPWRTIQVYHPNVNPMDMHWVTNLKQLRKANQTDWIEHRVKTCAVVGNSGILLGSNCGPTIDSMDIIIRMNLAEFGFGYSSDVGSRVTYMTINREQLRLVLACFLNMTKADVEELRRNTTRPVLSAECDNFIRRFRMIQEDVLWLFKGRLPGLQEVLSLLRKRFGLRFKFAYSPLDPINPTLKLWKQKYPTTGLAMYTAATQLCDEISLFGFYPFYTDDSNRTVLHHYYEPELKYFEVHHKMPQEYKIFLDLDRKGALRLIQNCTSNGMRPRRHGL